MKQKTKVMKTKTTFTQSEIEELIQSELDMIERYESEISDLEDEINEYEDEMNDNSDDYDLSYVNEKRDEIETLNRLIERCESEIERYEKSMVERITKLSFNGTTYELNYFEGRNKKTNEPFDCYGIYVNGESDTQYHLEHSKLICGNGEYRYVWVLCWCNNPLTEVIIDDCSELSFNDIIKVVKCINNNKPKVKR